MDTPLPWYVAIGASGPAGMRDIINLLKELRPDCNASFLVVLHRPIEYESRLQSVLQRELRLPVRIAEKDEPLLTGVCYIGHPNAHLTVSACGQAALINGGDNVFRNRTVDLLFGSVAEYARKRGIGVVLSGWLDDGSRGLAAIHRCGGVTMVLRPEPGEPGMQQSAIEYHKPVSFIGTSSELTTAILRIASE